jgi:4-hydroxy-tetrahydrodipicolinate reductase
MGQLAARLIADADDLALHASVGSADSLDLVNGADVLLDFTLPQASQRVVEHAIHHGIHAVTGTSGWSSERIAGLRRLVAAAPGIGVLVIPNFSIGSVLATSLAAQAARHFDSIEIIEAHHAGKVDSPSGTAVRTAELIGEARTASPVIAPHADQRARGQQVASVPIHSLRMQGVVAKQDVLFGGNGEVLTISHETLSPSSYEAGILLALRSAPSADGVVVGLDSLLGL